MALPNGAGGYQLGDGNLNEATLGAQGHSDRLHSGCNFDCS